MKKMYMHKYFRQATAFSLSLMMALSLIGGTMAFAGEAEEAGSIGETEEVDSNGEEEISESAEESEASGGTEITVFSSEDEDSTDVTVIASGKSGSKVTYELTSDGTLTISGSGAMYMDVDFSVPGYYSYRSQITNVIIEEGVTTIGYRAFYECSALESITIPDGITSISDDAFYDCESLTELELPNSLITIGSMAFRGCKLLAEINIPDSVTSIDTYTFESCKALTEIELPEGLTSLSNYLFMNCTSLTSVKVSDGLTEIGNCVFYGCSSLTEFTIPSSVASIGFSAFAECSSLTEITIPEGIAEIQKYTFYNCDGITALVIPDSVTVIGYGAFEYCNYITSITLSANITEIGDYAFYWCNSITEINLPDGLTAIGNYTFGNCTGLTELKLPDGITSIGNYAFYECKCLTTINIPDGVTYIGNYAFYYCGALAGSLVIPDAVTEIGKYAFYGCSSLTEISLSPNLTSIGNWAFAGCDGISEILIPDGIISINTGTFCWCYNLEYVEIGSSLESIGNRAFESCTSLSTIYFKSAVPAIETDMWDDLPCGLRILYHSSTDGWNEAQESWDLPYGTHWYDMDAIISADEFVINSELPLELEIGESSQLSTSADPYTTLFLEWSSGSSVAYVSQDGTVTGLSAGTAVVTVQTEDGTYKAQCTVTVTESSSALPTVNTVISDSTVSNNISDNNYSTYGSVVKSYLYENDDGTLTRVEYISGTGVVVETIDQATGQVSSVTTLEMELSIWGGFYSGEEYNFLVFGQKNYDEDNSVEVIRVVKYSKNWERLDACSIYGVNTYYPFASGSLRMTEIGGNLYIRSCHIMYASSDGLNHQANMTFAIDEEEMAVELASYRVVASSVFGYVSHSFNQFIQTDGEYVYCVDHGDAYPRAINLSKAAADGSSGDALEVYSILGEIGENATGVSIGGFELSTENCLIVGNSVDMSDEDTYDTSGQRNIFLIVTDKDLSGAKTIWLTDYTEDDGITPRTPQLVSVASDIFLIMWEEVDSDGGIATKLVLVDADGNLISDITELNIRLSDCQPVVTEDGIVTWYVTNGYRTTLYQINPFRLSETEITAESIASATVTLSNTSYTYNGTAKTPSVTVTTADGIVLTSGLDYTVSYSNNTDAGTAVVTVTGIGSFTGTVTAEFTISGSSLSTSKTVIALAESEFTYTGSAIEPEVVSVTYDGTELTEGVDYTISYGYNTNKGAGYVYITGIGNYTGSCTKFFTITAQSLSESNVTLEYESTSYTGSSLPSVTVTNAAGTTLTKGTDYTASYSNNTSVGTATVTITGMGNYTGTVTKTFTITAQSLSSSNVTLEYTSKTYTGSALTPSVTVKNAARTTLTSGTDYTVSYSNNISVGTATVTVTGKGNYTGTVTKTFTITAVSDSSGSTGTTVKSIKSAAVTLPAASYTYNGSARKPTPTVVLSGTTLTKGTDYTVSYKNNTNAGTATVTITGTGNYTGTVTATFTIKQKTISSTSSAAKVTLSTSSYTYNGVSRKPTPTVKITLNGSTKTLTKGTDYTVTYKNNTSAGTATVTITGTGNYKGTLKTTFTIKQKTISSTSSAAKITLSKTSYTYNGSAKKPTPIVKITLNGSTKRLIKGTDYTVTYKNNTKAGTATVTITGKGNYKGTLKKTFTINKASQTLKVTYSSSKTVKYSKVKSAKQTVKAITKVSSAKGTVTYTKSSGSKYLSVSKTTGKITVKKGTPKGTYKIDVKIKSAATTNYKSASKTVTITVKVK